MTPTTPRFAELHAPAHWRVVDFISDLHLQLSEPLTVRAWEQYLSQTRADAVFMLGDLFEVWVGDDGPQARDEDARFERHCLEVLQTAAARTDLYFMHGNRDFLFGPAAARAARLTLLDDPTVLDFGGRRWLLSHGDALCLDDADYLQFRAQVRAPQWQQAFLAQALAQRRTIARGLREQSEIRKQSGVPYADVDTALTQAWMQATDAAILIHGHTHKPADHVLADGRQRHVLSDWHVDASSSRAGVLRLQLAADGAPEVCRLRLDQVA